MTTKRRETFGEKIAATRGALTMTRKEMYERAGVGRMTAIRIEGGGTPLEFRDTHERLTRFLCGISAKQFHRRSLRTCISLALDKHAETIEEVEG